MRGSSLPANQCAAARPTTGSQHGAMSGTQSSVCIPACGGPVGGQAVPPQHSPPAFGGGSPQGQKARPQPGKQAPKIRPGPTCYGLGSPKARSQRPHLQAMPRGRLCFRPQLGIALAGQAGEGFGDEEQRGAQGCSRDAGCDCARQKVGPAGHSRQGQALGNGCRTSCLCARRLPCCPA